LKYEAHPESRLPSKSKAPPSRSHAKSESAWSFKHQAHSKPRPPSHLKASPSRSPSRTHQRHRSHRHRSSRAGDQPQVAMPFVIVPMQEVTVLFVIVPMQDSFLVVPITPDW